jgi:hypothetical protein
MPRPIINTNTTTETAKYSVDSADFAPAGNRSRIRRREAHRSLLFHVPKEQQIVHEEHVIAGEGRP